MPGAGEPPGNKELAVARRGPEVAQALRDELNQNEWTQTEKTVENVTAQLKRLHKDMSRHEVSKRLRMMGEHVVGEGEVEFAIGARGKKNKWVRQTSAPTPRNKTQQTGMKGPPEPDAQPKQRHRLDRDEDGKLGQRWYDHDEDETTSRIERRN